MKKKRGTCNLNKPVDGTSGDSLPPFKKRKNMQQTETTNPMAVMLNGYEDVWTHIFEFCSTSDLSPLLLVSKHVRSVMLTFDRFFLEQLIEFLRKRTNEIYKLPSLEYFLETAQFPHIDFKRLCARFKSTEDEPYLLHILKLCSLHIKSIPKHMLKLFPRVNELRQSFTELFKILKQLRDVGLRSLELVQKLQSLLRKCHGFSYNNERINKLCYQLLSGIDEGGVSDEDTSDDDNEKENVDNDSMSLSHRDDSCFNDILWVKEIIVEAVGYEYNIMDKCPEAILDDRATILAAVEQDGNVLCLPRLERYCDDKHTMLLALKTSPYPFQEASDRLKRDKEVALASLKLDGENFLNILEPLKSDRDFALSAIQIQPLALAFVPEQFRRDKEIALLAIRAVPNLIQMVSDELKNDKEVVLAAIVRDGACIEYASEKMQSNKEFAIIAVRNNPRAIHSLSADLSSDRDVILAGLSPGCNAEAMTYATKDMLHDKATLKLVLNMCPRFLAYVPQEFQNDPEVVQVAVLSNPWAICYALERPRGDLNIMSNVVRKEPRMIRYASDDLRNNKELVLSAVSNRGYLLRYASDELKNDEEVVLAAINSGDLDALAEASIEMKSNFAIVWEAVKRHAKVIQYASSDLKNNKDLALLAVREDRSCLSYISTDLQLDRDVILAALEGDTAIETASYIPEDLKNDREFMLLAVKRNGLVLFHANGFRSDAEVVLSAVENEARALKLASEYLKKDRDFMFKAVDKNATARKYVPRDIRSSLEFKALFVHEKTN